MWNHIASLFKSVWVVLTRNTMQTQDDFFDLPELQNPFQVHDDVDDELFLDLLDITCDAAPAPAFAPVDAVAPAILAKSIVKVVADMVRSVVQDSLVDTIRKKRKQKPSMRVVKNQKGRPKKSAPLPAATLDTPHTASDASFLFCHEDMPRKTPAPKKGRRRQAVADELAESCTRARVWYEFD